MFHMVGMFSRVLGRQRLWHFHEQQHSEVRQWAHGRNMPIGNRSEKSTASNSERSVIKLNTLKEQELSWNQMIFRSDVF
jgi:hypothetical protein